MSAPAQRWALGLEYDGRSFCGWQRQANARSIQAVVEDALGAIAQADIRVTAAGRTDTGVHASLQILHFDTVVARPAEAWCRGVNRFLPPEVAIRWAQRVEADFHARFAARSRRYSYFLQCTRQRPGLRAGRVGWTHWPLALERMQEALVSIEGRHDFSSFRAAECQARSPIKTMYSAQVSARGDLLRFDFHADAFLQHMIRNLIGALVYIGSGRKPPSWLRELLELRDRRLAAPTFAPDGLYLCGIEYDARFALPEQYVDPLP